MTDPVEIMVRAATPISREDLPETCWLSGDEITRMMRTALIALEDDGWRLVHPYEISLSMCEMACEERDIHGQNIGYQIRAAIRAAPTYGAPND